MPLTHPLPAAAKILGVKESWLRAKVKAREIPFVQRGKVAVGFTDAQLAEVLEALTAKPQNDPHSLTTPRSRRRAS